MEINGASQLYAPRENGTSSLSQDDVITMFYMFSINIQCDRSEQIDRYVINELIYPKLNHKSS